MFCDCSHCQYSILCVLDDPVVEDQVSTCVTRFRVFGSNAVQALRQGETNGKEWMAEFHSVYHGGQRLRDEADDLGKSTFVSRSWTLVSWK